MKHPVYRALGLISGTSIDGIDTALLETDGFDLVRPLGFMPFSYEPGFRARLRACFGHREGAANAEVAAFERELTALHATLVAEFLRRHDLGPSDIDLIGFHGQTVFHSPAERLTVQLGDGALLARLTGIPVVNDFRSADVRAGGQGAPLVPLYHEALAAELPKPLAVVNIGGVANVTWIGGRGPHDLLAFDTGPGNALLDDWMLRHTGQPFDADGACAASGRPDEAFVARVLEDPWFAAPPPKSLDRDHFKAAMPEGMTAEDGAATLTLLTARSLAQGLGRMPRRPERLLLAGGGRLNATLVRWIGNASGLPAEPVDALGWSGDGLEAEAFAYLAVRSRLELPLSVPGTTGVPAPVTGGRYHGVQTSPPSSERPP